MIWDFIRDFFVQFIFGGTCSDGSSFGGLIGAFINTDGDYLLGKGDEVYYSNGTICLSTMEVESLGHEWYITLGDWLSTTATIIVMCLIVFLLICLVRWIFRAVSSAMLLK